MRNLLITYLAGWLCGSAAAQQPAAAPPLDWRSFRQQILANHPLARQADLQLSLANATLLRARGGFDPKAYADFSAKEFADKNYFQY
ncbi:MAG: transporter, partial [Saprospiraceae bacterium]